MQVTICGIPHEVKEVDDVFNANEMHLGQINFAKAEIYINKNASDFIKKETICHEIFHGILVHLGYHEQSNDEQFVQSVANAINQVFDVKEES